MRNLATGLVAGLLFVTAGCGGDGTVKAKVYPVSGKVTVAGKPLADCVVQFLMVGKEGAYSGKIGADGSYSLASPVDGRSGAEAGKYKVIFQQSAEAMRKGMESIGAMGPPGSGAGPAGPFPAEYKSADTSTKEVEVKAESNTINIEIP